MRIRKRILSFIAGFIVSISVMQAQVSVIGTQIQHFNITPASLIQVSIMNNGPEQQVELESKLYNAANEILMSVHSAPFLLRNGLNTPASSSLKPSSVEYGSTNQSSYIKTSHVLPGGRFKLCVTVISSKSSEAIDDFCDEIEADLTQFLYLVSPPDKDIIPVPQPLLVWTHSEPFSILGQGEYYRMVAVELNEEQQPEEGIASNSPLFIKNYLTTHELLYPIGAKKLEAGKRYGWQVQKMSNNVIVNKSEAWEFTLTSEQRVKESQYTILKKTLDAGYYTAENNKVLFRFNEEYSAGTVSCIIYDSKRQAVKPVLENEQGAKASYNVKQNGQNRYEINLDKLNLSNGFYTLQVKNEKKEVFMLKFYVD